MNRIKVESSHLESVGYNHPLKTLEIEFKDGNIYQYVGVGLYTYNKLMGAPSQGKYYNRYIRRCTRYTGTKITESKMHATSSGSPKEGDKFWVISAVTYKVVDTRNTEEAAWSRAEVFTANNSGNQYFVAKVMGLVKPAPKPAPVRELL